MNRRRPSRRTVLSLALCAVTAGSLAACGEPATTAAPGPAPAVPSSAAPSFAAPSSRFVTRDGRRIAFQVTAGAEPAIVLDAGGGLDSTLWKDLVPQLARETGSRIITYDRAGVGASDEVAGAWDVAGAAADLEAGLRELGATSDVVLVSHSIAGEVATTFVRAHPGWVRGAVLVDANVPPLFTDAMIARIEAVSAEQLTNLPATKAGRQLKAVAANYGPAHRAYHQLTWPSDVPVTVLVSEKTPFDGSPEDAQAWRDAQAAFAGAAPNRRLETATGSSHDVPVDRPDLVVATVADMVRTVRR